MATQERGLIFANLVDFDTRLRSSQRRRRLRGQSRAIRRRLAALLPQLRAGRSAGRSPPITATIRRRRAPIIRASTCRCWCTGERVSKGVDLGTRATFADLGQTLAEVFGVGTLAHGTSFLPRSLMPVQS